MTVVNLKLANSTTLNTTGGSTAFFGGGQTGTPDVNWQYTRTGIAAYKWNGSSSTLIQNNIIAADTNRTGVEAFFTEHVFSVPKSGTWTPGATIDLTGANDKLELRATMDVWDDYDQIPSIYDLVVRDSTAGRGTIQTTSMTVYIPFAFKEYSSSYAESGFQPSTSTVVINPDYVSSSGTNSTIACDKATSTASANTTSTFSMTNVRNSTISCSTITTTQTLNSSTVVLMSVLSSVISCNAPPETAAGQAATVSTSNVKNSTISCTAVDSASAGGTSTLSTSNSISSTVTCEAVSDTSSGNTSTVTSSSAAQLDPPYDVVASLDGNHVDISWSHDTCNTFELERRVDGGSWEVVA